MADEALGAESLPAEDDGAPLPTNVTVSRPNRARSKVLQVRLETFYPRADVIGA
ncbi:hypothetical protein MMAD_12560 [Mycolicibacterium madagascariense]|uniref:Uncharacterized protein n=1 Tax=Mycolicibacterium madagascariense TaxID=212765 RepID=A0A7I7XDW2_9MYCO|nr:hypothetical protein [Mycolicibacterium madagascariense]MCV7013515.1 hypothetical protein [Mycolicibacterium madagascariense]BBZ26961.1 hypothetical protein MMAD_12560 [Mycolicibacterium madagascariense]